MHCRSLFAQASFFWCAWSTIAAPAVGAIQTVALSGQFAPGTASKYVGWEDLPVIGSDGTVTFLARTTTDIDATRQKFAVFQGAANRVELVIDSDSPSSSGEPDFLGGRFHLTVNDRGDFIADDRSFGSYPVNGIIASTNGSHEVAAKYGGLAPPSNNSFRSFSIPTLTNSGIVSFFAQVVDANKTYRGDGLWSTSVGRLWLEVGNRELTGTAISGFSSSQVPGTANNGSQTFLASSYASAGTIRDGIFTRGLSGFSPAVERGGLAPGTTGRFLNLRAPIVNGVGQFAFASTLSGTTPQTNTGIWASSSSGLRLIARQGAPVPDAVGTFAALDLTNGLNLNSRGDILFAANVSVSGAPQKRGLWLSTTAGLSTIAVESGGVTGTNLYFSRVFGGAILNNGSVVFGASTSKIPNDPGGFGNLAMGRWANATPCQR